MSNNKFYAKPFVIPVEAGLINGEIPVKYVVSLPNTSSAMQELLEQENKDTESGKNNYNNSVYEVLSVLDTFIREFNDKHNNRNKRSIEETDINLFDPENITLYLLWQIRHLIHKGKIIDKKCQDDYGKIYSKIKLNECRPSLDLLPEYLEENHKLRVIFTQNNYIHIRECLLNYIKPKVSLEDFNTLNQLASYALGADIDIPQVTLVFDSYTLKVNPKEAHEAGVKIDWDTHKVDLSDEPIYYPNENKIVLPNGKSFSAKLIEHKSKNSVNNREPIKKIGRNDPCICGSGKKYKKCCGNPLTQ